MFLFWHSWIFQLPLTQLTTAYFSTDSNTCMASLVLHSPIVSHCWWPCLASLKPFPQCATGFCVGPNSFHPLHKTSFWLDSVSLCWVCLLWMISAISSLEICLSDIQKSMLKNKLNNGKTETLLMRLSSKSFSVCKRTTISMAVKSLFLLLPEILGFYITVDMSIPLHTLNFCWSAYSELCSISTIQHLLSVDSTKTLASAFVLSRLDKGNSLLSGCPKHLIKKLQKVQNSAPRLVLKASPLLQSLHWLPIQASIECKLSTCCHSFFSDTSPVYLSDLLHIYPPSRQLRSSSDSRTLHIWHMKTKTFGHCWFCYGALSVWNSLPHEIRHSVNHCI